MLPNFAFEMTSAPEIIPQTRSVECLSSKPPSRLKSFSGSSSANKSDQSFKSSLHEASRRQEDSCRSKPVEDEADLARRPDYEADREKIESKKTPVDTDKDSHSGSDNSEASAEVSSSDLTTPKVSETGDNEEGSENELAGAGTVTLSAPLNEAVDLSLSINSDSDELKNAAAGSGAHRSIAPGDMLASGSGADTPDQKGAFLGQHTGTIEAGPDVKTDTPDSEMIASAKKATLTALNTANGTEKAAVHVNKGLDEWTKAEQNPALENQAKVTGRQDLGTASGSKNDAADRLADPLQPLHQILAEQSASGPRARSTKGVPAEDATAARTSEMSSDQQSAGRMQSDLLQGREGDGKIESVSADEGAPKIAKMNPGAKDSGFMQHQDQNFERLMEPATSTREKESSPGLLRTQTIDQIVNKAIYQLKNGQNSVQIDLKPEFLGQVRMQIVTVDQQVSIRIAAELPIVKEMLENNLQQLKADLQQQGLEVDEIQVSVSTDSQQNAENRKMKSDLLSKLKASPGKEGESDSAPMAETASRLRNSNSTVDMFA